MRRVLRKIASNQQDLGDVSTLADSSVLEQLFENRCCTSVWTLKDAIKPTSLQGTYGKCNVLQSEWMVTRKKKILLILKASATETTVFTGPVCIFVYYRLVLTISPLCRWFQFFPLKYNLFRHLRLYFSSICLMHTGIKWFFISFYTIILFFSCAKVEIIVSDPKKYFLSYIVVVHLRTSSLFFLLQNKCSKC